MMLTGATASPFAAIESFIQKTLFCGSSPYAALTGEDSKSCNNGTGSSARNGAVGNHEGCRALPENREDSEKTGCKKSD